MSEKKPFVTKRSGGCVGVGCLGVVVLFVLFCSGLNFPVMGKQGSFEGRVREDFGIGVPGSLRVVNAARKANREPAYFYECDLPAADGSAFLAALESAGKARGYDMGAERVGNRRLLGLQGPDWFTPESLANVVKLGVSRPKEADGYWIYFSPSRGKLFVVWFAT